MIIKYIKIKNIISNSSDIEIDFTRKYKPEDNDLFFEETIENKKRSAISQEAILKKIVFIGKNASHKTSILNSIDLSCYFIKHFKRNTDSLNLDSNENFHNDFDKWYKENKEILKSAILKNNETKNTDFIFEEFSKHMLKNISLEDKINNSFKYFFDQYAFDKEKELYLNIIFCDQKTNKNYDYKITFSNFNNIKFIWEAKLNNKDIDLYEHKLEFNHDFASFELYNLNGIKHRRTKRNDNIFLKDALQYFYYNKFNKNKKDIIEFFNILDPSIIDIKIEEMIKDRKMEVTSITRKYGTYIKDIPLNKLSTGTQMFIVYSYFILKNDFIIFDEIEQSLHLKLVELLLDIAKINNKQILFSTHTPLIVEEFVKNYELYVFELNSENELKITKGTQIYKAKDNFVNKYMSDLVSNITNSDLDFIRKKLIYEK